MCHINECFFERIDTHFHNFDQFKRQSPQMIRNLEKSTVAAKAFLDMYYSNTNLSETSSSNEFNETPKSTSTKPLLTVITDTIENNQKKNHKKEMMPKM